jgi:glycerate kinase
VVALAGTIRAGELAPLYNAGLTAAFAITDGPQSYERAFARTAAMLRRTAGEVVRLWMAAGRRARSENTG